MLTADEIVSNFFLDTCQLNPQPNLQKLDVFKCLTSGDVEYGITTAGSARDIYIQPMLPCIHGVNRLLYPTHAIAVPSMNQLPRHLPSIFVDELLVSEIIDSEFSGFVYLLSFGTLSRSFDGTTIGFKSKRVADYLNLYSPEDRQIQEFVYPAGRVRDTYVIRCLEWPTQAAEWRKRRRKYGWPDAATIADVVSSGCEVVLSEHHVHCSRSAGKATNDRYRLTFSIGETVLLNSWTPVQQITYHILRYVVDKSGLTEARNDEGHRMLSRYHLKTLMMWTCEMKRASWWTRTTIVQLSRNVMQLLLESCVSSRCTHYFIITSNVFEYGISRVLINQLTAFTDTAYLCQWLVNNYVRKCAELSPLTVSKMFCDISTDMKLHAAVNSLVLWQRSQSLLGSFKLVQHMNDFGCLAFAKFRLIPNLAEAAQYWKAFIDVDQRIHPAYITSVFCLTLSSAVDAKPSWFRAGIYDLLIAVLTNFEKCVTTTDADAAIILQLALYLMQMSSKPGGGTSSLVFRCLSYAQLKAALQCKHRSADDIRPLVNIYLAVLHCITEKYRSATRYCERVIGTGTADKSEFVVEGDSLPHVSSEVDAVLGLAALYQYLRDGSMSRKWQQVSVVRIFTVSLFAHYVMFFSRAANSINCRANELQHIRVKQYRQHFVKASQVFSTDFLLFYNVIGSIKRPANWTGERRDARLSPAPPAFKFSAGTLREQLILLSVEQLTSYRQNLLRDYRLVCELATDDIRALYAYRCGMYEECLDMIRPTVVRLWGQIEHFTIPVFGCMTHLMDDNIAALYATGVLKARDWKMYDGRVTQLTVLVYLLVECKLKLRQYDMASDLRFVVLLHHRLSVGCVADRLMLSLVYRRAVVGISNYINSTACDM